MRVAVLAGTRARQRRGVLRYRGASAYAGAPFALGDFRLAAKRVRAERARPLARFRQCAPLSL